ncbi:MBL fold metallo-hydrolase [Candidatus Parvarchaeota archaeon]|nr:MBL fold metallo-hydrolase [Candidatus Parvarchaeota archaeon]
MAPVTIKFLGSAHEVGRSSILLQTDKHIMLDHGLKLFANTQQEVKPLPYEGKLDFAIISHGHMDHVGNVPALFGKHKINLIATPPTKSLCEILWEDSLKLSQNFSQKQMHAAMKSFVLVPYKKQVLAGRTTFSFHDAGHITGSAITALEYEGKKIIYSGDINGTETRMNIATQFEQQGDVLIMESTYAKRDHPDRKELEKRLKAEIKKTVDAGGNALLPAFAIGRTQELGCILHDLAHDIDIFVDGMGKLTALSLLEHPEYVRDFEAFQASLTRIRFVNSRQEREKALMRPSVVISTAGMLQGGPAMHYLLNLNPDSKVFMTGYSVDGTNGYSLLNSGEVTIDERKVKIDLPVEYLDFSAHAGRSELLGFVKRINPGKVICNHGDSCEEFAAELKEMGFDALAPQNGELIKIE